MESHVIVVDTGLGREDVRNLTQSLFPYSSKLLKKYQGLEIEEEEEMKDESEKDYESDQEEEEKEEEEEEEKKEEKKGKIYRWSKAKVSPIQGASSLHLMSLIPHSSPISSIQFHHKGDYFVTICPQAPSSAHSLTIHQVLVNFTIFNSFGVLIFE